MTNMATEVFLVGEDKTTFLKKELARILYSKKIDQSKISEILNLSQPMVSNYCGSTDKISENIMHIAEQISDKIINGYPTTFHTCVSFSDKTLEGNFFIANKADLISDEKSKVIDNLNQAFLLLKGRDIGDLVPKVKINIAMAKENPENSDDIAAFLNGLIIVEDRVTGYNGIRFGRSKHLSTLLLDFKDKLNVNAIMNVAYNKDILKTDFNVGFLSKNFRLIDKNKQYDIVLHKGDFGIEPCAYVIGKDAVDVSKKILRIIKGE